MLDDLERAKDAHPQPHLVADRIVGIGGPGQQFLIGNTDKTNVPGSATCRWRV